MTEALRLLCRIAMLANAGLAIAAEPQRPLSVDDHARVLQVADPAISPDGAWVAYTVGTTDVEKDRRQRNVWMVSWDGRQRIQLTHGPHSSHSARWVPDGSQLSFLSNRLEGGGTQLWVLDRRGGEARRIMERDCDIEKYAWSPDSKRVALVIRSGESTEAACAEKKKPTEPERPAPIVIDRYHFKNDEVGYIHGTATSRIFVYEPASAKLTALTSEAGFEEGHPTWSPDGTQIAFVSNRDAEWDRTENTDVWVATPGSGTPLRKLTAFEGQDNGPLAWSPDGKRVAYRQGPPPKYWLYHFHEIVPVTGGTPIFPTRALDRDGTQPWFSANGAQLEFLVTDRGLIYPARVPASGGPIQRMTADLMTTRTLAHGAGRTVVTADGDTAPAELFALERGKLRRLTTHNDGWLSQVRLSKSQDIEFAAKDGVRVHGIMTLPVDYEAGKRYPALLWIHGGPYGQDKHAFDFERQLFAAQGYVVLQINYRGSSGRGVAFARGIFADWGNRDLADLLAGIDHAVGLGVADPQRLVVGGWSQGGILTNYAIAYDTRFKAAISGAGAGNQLALYGADTYAFLYDNEFKPPWEDTQRWIRLSSPFFHADRIRTPTLYIGGEKDFNVPIIGGEQMYQALRSLGVPTQLVIYPGEHHAISRPSFKRDLLQRFIDWYAKHLH
jgi:dipeptidyl aminopeptidase/acylaminoacyl peptidase